MSTFWNFKKTLEVKYNVQMLDSSLTKINMFTNEHLMHKKIKWHHGKHSINGV
jgi:hypothetical protein